MRGIPQLYYGTEIGLEGWKDDDDRDLRRDFPWQVIGADNRPQQALRKERDIYDWTRALIRLRKQNAALKYGTTNHAVVGRTSRLRPFCAIAPTDDRGPSQSSTTAKPTRCRRRHPA